jgi:hypothetical protein
MTSTGHGLAPNRLIRSSQFWQLELAFRRAHARTGVGPHGRGQLRRHVWRRPCFLPTRTVASWVCQRHPDLPAGGHETTIWLPQSVTGFVSRRTATLPLPSMRGRVKVFVRAAICADLVLPCAGKPGGDATASVMFAEVPSAGFTRRRWWRQCTGATTEGIGLVSSGGRAGALQQMFECAEVARDRRLDSWDG